MLLTRLDGEMSLKQSKQQEIQVYTTWASLLTGKLAKMAAGSVSTSEAHLSKSVSQLSAILPAGKPLGQYEERYYSADKCFVPVLTGFYGCAMRRREFI